MGRLRSWWKRRWAKYAVAAGSPVAAVVITLAVTWHRITAPWAQTLVQVGGGFAATVVAVVWGAGIAVRQSERERRRQHCETAAHALMRSADTLRTESMAAVVTVERIVGMMEKLKFDRLPSHVLQQINDSMSAFSEARRALMTDGRHFQDSLSEEAFDAYAGVIGLAVVADFKCHADLPASQIEANLRAAGTAARSLSDETTAFIGVLRAMLRS